MVRGVGGGVCRQPVVYLSRHSQQQDVRVLAGCSTSVVVVEAMPLEAQTYWGDVGEARTARQRGSCGGCSG